MSSRLLFVLMSASLLLAEPTVGLAQGSPEKVTSVPTYATAKDSNPITPQVLFKPSGTGNPPPTRGAGSRNDRRCSQDATTQSIPLTTLIPNNQVGLTTAEHPTVWVYLPKTSARQMVLSVKAEGSQPHSQRFIQTNGESGIVGIPFDDNAPSLEIGKSYQWAIVLMCGDRPNPNDPFVTAWVRRVAPAQTVNPAQTALERAVRYGEQGIWYDALTALAEARRSQPNNGAITKVWADFLTQPTVGLGAIASAPVR